MIRGLLLVLAIGLSVAAFWLWTGAAPLENQGMTDAAAGRTQPAPLEMVPVLAARGVIDPGSTVVAEQVQWIDWPVAYLPASFIQRSQEPEAGLQIIDRIATDRFVDGEPLRWAAFQQERANSVAATLAPGMRAIAVRVSVEATAGGFVLPNNRVDVLHIFTPSGTQFAQSRIVASNVRVIALDQTTTTDESMNILVERTATLEVTSEQAQQIAAAEQSGSLALALRPHADEAEAAEPERPIIRVLRGGIETSQP